MKGGVGERRAEWVRMKVYVKERWCDWKWKVVWVRKKGSVRMCERKAEWV